MLPRPGFKVELCAAEPVVMDPIDIQWGPDGRAWVVEMTDYPMGIWAVRTQVLHKLHKLADQVKAEPDAAASMHAARHEAIRQKIDQALSAKTTAERQAALKKFEPMLKLHGDTVRGKKMFVEATCAVCHRLDDVGEHVGPDLRTLVDRSPGALTVAAIDPSRAFLDRYAEYIAVTKDGLTHGGMLLDESSNSIVLVGVDGKQEIILRKDLDELVNTGRSHMPDGLEGKLDRQKMADLFAFVGQGKLPRKQFPGNEPQVVKAAANGSLWLTAAHAEIYGPRLAFESKYRNLGFWQSQEDHAAWSVEIGRPGTYEVWLEWACEDRSAGSAFLLQAGGQKLPCKVPSTVTWDRYGRAKFGELKLDSGECRVGLRADGPLRSALMDLRAIRLIPIPPAKSDGPRLAAVKPAADGVLRLTAASARPIGPHAEYLPESKVLAWFSGADQVQWEIEIPNDAAYEVWIEYAVDDSCAGRPFDLRFTGVDRMRLPAVAAPTGSWEQFRRVRLGRMELTAGTYQPAIRPGDRFDTPLMDLRQVELLPAGK